jgi:hypothetical protein
VFGEEKMGRRVARRDKHSLQLAAKHNARLPAALAIT